MAQKKETFENAILKLEENIDKLENEKLTLDEALKAFEEGIRLARICENHLRSTEGKLKELLKDENGEFLERVLGISADSITGESIVGGETDNG